MKSMDDLRSELKAENLHYLIDRGMIMAFLPNRFKTAARFLWDGGGLHPDGVVQILLNGWYSEVMNYIEKNPGRHRATYDKTHYWVNVKNVIDDGTSDEIYDTVLKNAREMHRSYQEQYERKKLAREQSKYYTRVRFLKTDIDRIVDVIRNAPIPDDFKNRVLLAFEERNKA